MNIEKLINKHIGPRISKSLRKDCRAMLKEAGLIKRNQFEKILTGIEKGCTDVRFGWVPCRMCIFHYLDNLPNSKRGNNDAG